MTALGTDGMDLNLWGELDAGTDLTVYRAADYNKSKVCPHQ